MKKLVSGIKPTGDITLGNYIGAIKQFVMLQGKYENYIFIADLHALTIKNDPIELRKKIRKIAAIYLACGLDPNKTSIFIQSENPYHANLSWILECNSYMGELSRMTQYKDKSADKTNDNISCGLFTYPVLMASDIIIYDADVVPVGVDQKQHVELTRNIVQRFNHVYGDTFTIPEALLPEIGAKIKDLQNPLKKMSKSGDNDKGCIMLLDDLNIIRKKIMSAITDSDSRIMYDQNNKPGISNLMTIYSVLTNKDFKTIEQEFEGQNYGAFKTALADTVINIIKPIQTKYYELIESDYIDQVLDQGLNKVLPLAKAKYDAVLNKIGLKRK